MSTIRYRKLPGKRRGLFKRSSVWLAPDHILLIEGSRIRETYKRIYLRDIQGLIIMKRPRFLIQAPTLLISLAFVIAPLVWLPAAWRAAYWLSAALLLAAGLVYLYVAAFFYGCRFYLATAVGNVFAPSVFRIWQARRFSERVRPLILEAQSPRE
jgi:hypothetical protein